jgi:SAM-dependent methyltransferase
MLAPIESRVIHGEAESFAERLLEQINGGALAIMVSVGHRTGLFDALAELGEVSPTELALATFLDAGYVREWLGAMVVGRIVEQDGKSGTYSLPDAHVASLCRTSASNLAVLAQSLCALARAEDALVECFRRGSRAADCDRRLREITIEEREQSLVPELESSILPLVPGLLDRMRLGVEVLEVGCGRGQALLQLAARFPRSRFHGLDGSAEAIEQARTQARERGLRNVTFERGATTELGLEHHGRYDLIVTFDPLHEQREPAAVLASIAESLAPGGVYLTQNPASSGQHGGDVGLPLGPLLYTISCMRCTSVAWGRERTGATLAAAGFGSVVVHQLEHDLQNDLYVCRRSEDELW